MKPVVALVALTLFLSGLVGVTPAQAADEPTPVTVTVTWPEVTRFNPDQVGYSFTVADTDGSGHLFAWWGASADSLDPAPHPIPVPADGVVDMDFWQDMHGQVVIVRCPTTSYDHLACTKVAASPELDVFSAIALFSLDIVGGTVKTGPATARITYAPALPALRTTWQLVDHPDTPAHVYASGELAEGDLVTDPDSGISSFPFTVPAGLASGDYYLTVHQEVDSTDFGHLEGDFPPGSTQLVRVDSVVPKLKVAKVPATLYPASDNYLDALEVRATATEPTSGTFDVISAAGKRVFRSAQHSVSPDGTDPSITWTGRHLSNGVVPAGTYTLRLSVVDAAGNQATWTGRVAVSHKRLTWVTHKRTVSAAASRTGRPLVGRCSTLARLPHGVLGYYSQTRCKGSNAQSVVATDHGMYLPKAHRSRYLWAQVTLNGSPATSSPNDYFVMGYVSPRTNKVVHDRVFRAGNKHPGQRVSSRLIFDRKTDHPYLIWFNGLTAGSRYDVRSYTVKVRYQALR